VFVVGVHIDIAGKRCEAKFQYSDRDCCPLHVKVAYPKLNLGRASANLDGFPVTPVVTRFKYQSIIQAFDSVGYGVVSRSAFIKVLGKNSFVAKGVMSDKSSRTEPYIAYCPSVDAVIVML